MKKMKLTPEQRAFYEYGKAVKDLGNIIKEIRNNARMRFRVEYCELPLSSRAEILNLFGFEGFIDKVRQKRAACRAWVIPSHERICENCAHEGTHPYATPCSECFRCPFAQVYEGFSDNWEPRKEGE